MADSIPSRAHYEGLPGGWADGRLGQAYDLVAAVMKATEDQPHLKFVFSDLLDAIECADEELSA